MEKIKKVLSFFNPLFKRYYPIQIRIVTTSNWTTLRPINGTQWTGPAHIIASEDAEIAEFDGSILRLTQICEQADDCKPIEMVVKLNLIRPNFLMNLSKSLLHLLLRYEEPKVEFEIERGHWGWTHVQLSNYLGETPIVVENYWWCGITPGERNFCVIKTASSNLYNYLSSNPALALNAHSLNNKTLIGYQGWFGCPEDGSDRNSWIHWFRRDSPPQADKLEIDIWPDMSELSPDESFSTDMTLPNGKDAKLFSSYKQKTVVRHFKWMREYNIDGVFVQRFITEVSGPFANFCFVNQVTQNVQLGSEKHSRLFAVMYDLTNAIGSFEKLKSDWTFLVDVLKITESPNYIHHNGKPVVGVWGPGFDSRRTILIRQARRIIYWLQTGAPEQCRATVVGGVPKSWRTLEEGGDSIRDERFEWGDVYRSYDVISPWSVGRYSDNNSADVYKNNYIIPDLAHTTQIEKTYMPVIWPGYSFHNSNPSKPLNEIPRNRGMFLWRQAYNAISAGVKMLYIAMFDEVDEAIAIFKLTPNQLPIGAALVPYNSPNDLYLKICGYISQMLRGEIPLSSDLPPYSD